MLGSGHAQLSRIAGLGACSSSHHGDLPGDKEFPAEERYGLTRQVRESASSVAANIAEGCGRDSDREFVRFLRIASGSASETLYHLILARDLGFLNDDTFHEMSHIVEEVRRMLTAFIRRFRDGRS